MNAEENLQKNMASKFCIKNVPTFLEINCQQVSKHSLEDAAAYCSPWEGVAYLFIDLLYQEKSFQES